MRSGGCTRRFQPGRATGRRTSKGSYAPKADLQTLAALGRRWLYVNRGGHELQWSGHCNTEDVRWLLRERPLVVQGADPLEFACEVPAIVLQKQMRSQIENFLDDLLTWTTFEISWTQRYAVEASSRMLYTLEHGAVISKQEALDWATEAMFAAGATSSSRFERTGSFSGTTRRDQDPSTAPSRSSST